MCICNFLLICLFSQDDEDDDDENDFSGPALGGHVKTQSDFSDDDEEDKPMTMRMMMMRPTTTTTTGNSIATTINTKTNAATPLNKMGSNHLNVPTSKKQNYKKDAYDV